MAQIRNVFHIDDEPSYWRDAVKGFPNKVPRFKDKDKAVSFIKQFCHIESNPDEPGLIHSVTTFTDWDQIEKHLIPKINEYDSKWAPIPSPSSPAAMQSNRYMEKYDNTSNIRDDNDGDSIGGGISKHADSNQDAKCHPVFLFLQSRLNLPIHSRLSRISTMNTFNYLFHHMRCGIFVMIRNNQVVIFAPFVNKDYTNNWSDKLQIGSDDGEIESYYDEKRKIYRSENIIKKEKWWANGNIIDNEHFQPGDESKNTKPQWWGDHFLFQMKDLLADTCANRSIPDCEFFLNKRDYPQLKFNAEEIMKPVEPYGFIFDKDDRIPDEDVLLGRHLYKSYAPILSYYTSSRFADIPLPPSEDWEAATGEVFAPSFKHTKLADGSLEVGDPRDLFTTANLRKFERPWSEKVPTAFFRGGATGGGVTVETNQRLHLAFLSHEWSLADEATAAAAAVTEEEQQAPGVDLGLPHLDAKITGWNMRDKKIASGKMNFINPKGFKFTGDKKQNFVPIYEQSKYKYVVYVEGHCAACRYGFMMQLNSVILKVESKCVASELWYFPLLQPYVDHVPIKSDLSDLKERIEWCRANDEKCREIAHNAKQLYERYISRDGILDYMQAIFIEIAKRWISKPRWLGDSSAPCPRPCPNFPELNAHGNPRYCVTKSDEYCSTCKILKEKDEEMKRIQLALDSQKKNETDIENDEKKRRLLERRNRTLEEKRSKNRQIDENT